MTFLAIDSQKQLFTLQKSQAQFEQTLIMYDLNATQKDMALLTEAQSENANWDADSDPAYKELQQLESYYETRQDALDSQITLLENEISSLKNLVNNNIKSSCTLNLVGQ